MYFPQKLELVSCLTRLSQPIVVHEDFESPDPYFEVIIVSTEVKALPKVDCFPSIGSGPVGSILDYLVVGAPSRIAEPQSTF